MMKKKEHGYMSTEASVILLIGVICLLITYCIFLYDTFQESKTRQEALTLAQNGYETYYNGQKIDYDKIDFNHCTVTIDDVNNRVLLTQE